jgi:hypothetical protein
MITESPKFREAMVQIRVMKLFPATMALFNDNGEIMGADRIEWDGIVPDIEVTRGGRVATITIANIADPALFIKMDAGYSYGDLRVDKEIYSPLDVVRIISANIGG